MQVTREQIEGARRPDCKWSAAALAAAIDARFPGGDPVDLAALIDAWLADEAAGKLTPGTISQCAILAAKLANVSARGCYLRPKQALARVRATL